jgi:hypothetical protein
MNDQTHINNLLSSIIWTASKLQELNSNVELDASNIPLLAQVDNDLDTLLDYEETHI